MQPEGELKTNIEALAESVAGIDDLGDADRRPSSNSRLAERRRQSSTYEEESSPGSARRPASSSSSYDGEDFARRRRRDPDHRHRRRRRTSSTSRPQEPATSRGRLLRGRRLQDRRRGRHHGRRRRRLPRRRRGRADLQGRGRRLRTATRSPTTTTSRARSPTRPDDSLADVYVDIGGLIEAAGRRGRPAGARASTARSATTSRTRPRWPASSPAPTRSRSTSAPTSAAASIAAGDVTDLLGSLPGRLVAAFATPDFGERLKQVIDQHRRDGHPGRACRRASSRATLAQPGIDLDKIAGSTRRRRRLRRGQHRASLGGAAGDRDRSDPQAAAGRVDQHRHAAARLGHARRHRRSAATRAASPSAAPSWAQAAGRRSPTGDRIAVGYGVAATRRRSRRSRPDARRRPGLQATRPTRSADTDLTGFVDVGAVLELVESSMAATDPDFEQARPYLDKLDFLASAPAPATRRRRSCSGGD